MITGIDDFYESLWKFVYECARAPTSHNEWFILLNINSCIYEIESDCNAETHSRLRGSRLCSFANHNNDLFTNTHIENIWKKEKEIPTQQNVNFIPLTGIVWLPCKLVIAAWASWWEPNFTNAQPEKKRERKWYINFIVYFYLTSSSSSFLRKFRWDTPTTILLSFHSVLREYIVCRSTNSNTLSLKLDNCVKMLTRAHLMMFIQQEMGFCAKVLTPMNLNERYLPTFAWN